MLLRAHSCVRTLSGLWTSPDHPNAGRSVSSSSLGCSSSSFHMSIRLSCSAKRCRKPKCARFSCKSSGGSFDGVSSNLDDSEHEFLEASVLVPETILHYQMRKQGFQENLKWQTFGQSLPYSLRAKESRSDATLIGHEFLSRFKSPTIFLKISCDGDFLLPIIVGEFAVEKLIGALLGEDIGDSPDQFQLVRNVVNKLGYEVKMARITERVVNTYFAKLYLSEPEKNDCLTMDLRPSDAINVATRCKAPIFVNKQIVLIDAIKIGGKVRDSKPTYDVFLDSAIDGPDLLSEELSLILNIDIAVKEERYNDAAELRDKLVNLRRSKHDL